MRARLQVTMMTITGKHLALWKRYKKIKRVLYARKNSE